MALFQKFIRIIGEINMSIINHYSWDVIEYEMKCPHCGEEYIVWDEEQVPGFRMLDEERCPYCNELTGRRSMEVEYHVRRRS